MATKVVTVSTCDRCGLTAERQCAEQSVPPQFWWHVTLHQRAQGRDGWTDSAKTFLEVCQECGDAIKRLALTSPERGA